MPLADCGVEDACPNTDGDEKVFAGPGNMAAAVPANVWADGVSAGVPKEPNLGVVNPADGGTLAVNEPANGSLLTF